MRTIELKDLTTDPKHARVLLRRAFKVRGRVLPERLAQRSWTFPVRHKQRVLAILKESPRK